MVRAHRRAARPRGADDEAAASRGGRSPLGAGDHARGVRRAGLLHDARAPRGGAGAALRAGIESRSRPQGGAMADEPTKYQLTEDEIPTHWVNLLPDLPGEPLPPLHPGTQAARRPRRPHAALPDGADPAGGLARAGDRDPRRGPRRLPAVAPDAAVPRAPPRGRARHAGAHLLQVRGRLAARVAQAQHGGPAGLRERARRREEALDRDRRRAVGLGAGLRLPAVRPRVRGVHGRLVATTRSPTGAR